MKWCRRWRRREEELAMREEEQRRERQAEEDRLRETAERWSEVSDVSGKLEAAREHSGQDRFLADLADAMRRRPPRREARP